MVIRMTNTLQFFSKSPKIGPLILAPTLTQKFAQKNPSHISHMEKMCGVKLKNSFGMEKMFNKSIF
jgi:hypothetical protein